MKVLTKRQFEIAELVALGYSESEIAAKLCISTVTVHNHTYNIRKKINARSAVDIARKFILSLENPKEYFLSVSLLTIQLSIIFNCLTMDLRHLKRIARNKQTFRNTRIYRTAS